jgi:hypothetical protein
MELLYLYMFKFQHFVHGREGTKLISFKEVRFQKSVRLSKFTPFNMTYPVNDDDDEKNNHDNNNEQYTYSIGDTQCCSWLRP